MIQAMMVAGSVSILIWAFNAIADFTGLPIDAQAYLAGKAPQIGISIEIHSIYRPSQKERPKRLTTPLQKRCLDAELADLAELGKRLGKSPTEITELAQARGRAAPFQISLWDNEKGREQDERILKSLFIEYEYRRAESGAADARFLGIGIDHRGRCLRPLLKSIAASLRNELGIPVPRGEASPSGVRRHNE